eukprot:TRINITY_DN1670_c0_g1_i1.p1 TRINITY_DN1670_c0_g1~~TRINITY_DN1670_c0_g1_i1.p1  ORF type:complete len:269 (+),score=69.03 TRINITY_DN1670_c0_g1_i1:97-807(+)
MGDSEYSFSLTTFSQSGKLYQIEYALNAVAEGPCCLGIKAKNGVVLAGEKKIPSILVDEATNQKVLNLSENVGVVSTGLVPDYRVLLRRGRQAAVQYYTTYREQMPVSQLVREEAAVMQEFTQQGGVRPFGISLMIAGYDDAGPQLFQVDPSGAYFGWKASAIGKNHVNAKSFLEKRYDDEIDIDDAIHTAIKTLKEGFEGPISAENIEIGVVTETDRKFRVLTTSQVQDYLEQLD